MTRDGCSVNTDYVKIPILPDFDDNFTDLYPILSKLYTDYNLVKL